HSRRVITGERGRGQKLMARVWRSPAPSLGAIEQSQLSQSGDCLAAPHAPPADRRLPPPMTISGQVPPSQTVAAERLTAVLGPVSHRPGERSHIRQIYIGLHTIRSNDALQRDAVLFDSAICCRRDYCRGISPYFTSLFSTHCPDSRPGGRSQPVFITQQSRDHT
ncbi:MAG: hypothetical protein A07HR60_01987, partial [uncultured archaeon A07HR60]